MRAQHSPVTIRHHDQRASLVRSDCSGRCFPTEPSQVVEVFTETTLDTFEHDVLSFSACCIATQINEIVDKCTCMNQIIWKAFFYDMPTVSPVPRDAAATIAQTNQDRHNDAR